MVDVRVTSRSDAGETVWDVHARDVWVATVNSAELARIVAKVAHVALNYGTHGMRLALVCEEPDETDEPPS